MPSKRTPPSPPLLCPLYSISDVYSIPTLHGPFDIIFIDTEKKEYTEVYDMIMERKLLAQDGIIVADNVLAKGCTVDSKVGNPLDSTIQNGVELRKFNDHIAKVPLSPTSLRSFPNLRMF